MPVDEETSKILALVTRRGMLLPKVLYFGPKQGPGIFQSFVDSVFSRVVGDENEEFLSVFVDDCNISTPKLQNETDEDCWNRHLRHLEIFLTKASERKIQFKLEKVKLKNFSI